jgi:hypothetical protein
MERSEQGDRSLAQRVVHWRSIALVGACVAGGVTLSMMVIGSVPTIAVTDVAAPEVSSAEVVVVGPTTTAALTTTTTGTLATPGTEVLGGSAELPVDPAAPLGGDTVVEDAPAVIPVNAPAGAAPNAPTAPAPAATPTTRPPVAIAPVATVAPPKATVPPAPITASPPPAPTTQPPANVSNLTYPSYTVSEVSDVSLQFDGSSISVISLAPQPKWVYEIEKNGPRSVEIKFFNVETGRDREFHATVEGGRIKVES